MDKNFREDYQWLVKRFPNGLAGGKNAVLISIDNNKDLLILVAEPENGACAVCLFLRDAQYARKTLVVHEDGRLDEESEHKIESGIRVNVLPDFDMTEHEPVFTSSNEKIFELIIKKLHQHFPNN